MTEHELDITGWRGASEGLGGDTDAWTARFVSAVDAARDRGGVTYLTEKGERIAAIVPLKPGPVL
jgi:hypothetical protein